ncbi:helix-turn-helix domain-containing protein [Novosphingobium bradum]|uniref:Helix-turn-helix domain-containing protein n=1 Tax=Novosphingobium bradum TaxID=1737444 RepID=A0ABV7IQF9_9SPHN
MRFHEPPAGLRRYFTSFYLVEIAGAPHDRLADHLHPEWANLRFFSGGLPLAEGTNGDRVDQAAFCATGPSSRAVRFSVGPTRMWGIGLLPLGWAMFVDRPAAELADRVVDGLAHPAFARFAPLAHGLFARGPDPEAELARISAHFTALVAASVPREDQILAVHAALIDADVASAHDLAARTGLSQRTVERVARAAFGFTPKLLLRRQRFMRSLAQYMLDPSLKWIGALDGHYHDQAQFVRDFRAFMGMTPREYAAMDKPVIGAIMRERERIAGRAVQALDSPTGGGPRGEGPVAGKRSSP